MEEWGRDRGLDRSVWWVRYCNRPTAPMPSGPALRYVVSRSAFYNHTSILMKALKEKEEEINPQERMKAKNGKHAFKETTTASPATPDVCDSRLSIEAFVTKYLQNRPAAGSRPALSSDAELRVRDALLKLEEVTYNITLATISAQLYCEAGRPQTPEEQADEKLLEAHVIERVSKLGRHGIAGFLERHNVIRSHARAITDRRAAANQPEKAVQWARLIIHASMLVQITDAVGQGEKVPGWCCPTSGPGGHGPQREDGSSDPRPGDLELRVVDGKDVFWVTALGCELKPLSDIITLDEVPMPLADIYDLTYNISPKVRGRVIKQIADMHVTATPVSSRHRGLLGLQLILPGTPQLSSSFGTWALHKNVTIAITETGYQTEESFLAFATDIGKLAAASKTNWVPVLFDGHVSHLSRATTGTLVDSFLIPLVEPSNTSSWLQCHDLGANSLAHVNYRQAHCAAYDTSAISLSSLPVGNERRLELVVKAFLDIPKETWASCYKHAGLTAGTVIDFHSAFGPETFAQGQLHRGPDLPAVTQPLLDVLFGPKNLCQPWGAAMLIPSNFGSLPTPLLEKVAVCVFLLSFLLATQLTQLFSQAAKALAKLPIEGDTTVIHYMISKASSPSSAAALLFGSTAMLLAWANGGPQVLEESPDYTRPGHINTSYGLSLSGDRAARLFQAAEEKARDQAAEQARVTAKTAEKLANEAKLRVVLVAGGWLTKTDGQVTMALLKGWLEAQELAEPPTKKLKYRAEYIDFCKEVIEANPKKVWETKN